MLNINIKTNPLSTIVAGDIYAVPEGQLKIIGPIVIEDGGELRIEDNADLITE